MATMVRKQVYLRRDQDKRLKQLARAEGRTEAELIRNAVDEFSKSRERAVAWEAEKKFIEERMKLPPTPGGRSWKREDIYDRYERSVAGRHKRAGVPV